MRAWLTGLHHSVKHLRALDEVFRQHYPEYKTMSDVIENMPLYDELRKELYVGGKKRGSYARQMILGDILQYVFTGRGYYFAVRSLENRKSFISMIMYTCNLLIMMEDVSVDVKLRNQMLDHLSKEMGTAFAEDADQEIDFQNLRDYDGKIVGDDGLDFDTALDSMLPKRVGVVPELLVYAHLVRKNLGYTISLLQAQRLLGNQESENPYIVPPDFLLVRSKGEVFGLEVGRGKESQISSFSTVTSIPIFTVGIGSGDQPQPFRCGRCQKWIVYCEEVIRLCSENQEPEGAEFIDCAQCAKYGASLTKAQRSCPHIVYHGRAHDHTGSIKQLRYHYKCVADDSEVEKVLSRSRTAKLVAPIPWVNGLQYLRKDV